MLMNGRAMVTRKDFGHIELILGMAKRTSQQASNAVDHRTALQLIIVPAEPKPVVQH